MFFRTLLFSAAIACSPMAASSVAAQSPTADIWMRISEHCPSTPQAVEDKSNAVVAAILIPSLLESAIKGFGAILTKAGGEKVTQFSAVAGEYFMVGGADGEHEDAVLRKNKAAGCLTVVVGDRTGKKMQDDFTKDTSFFSRSVQPEGQSDGIPLYKYLNETFGVDQLPYAYLELELVAGGSQGDGFWT